MRTCQRGGLLPAGLSLLLAALLLACGDGGSMGPEATATRTATSIPFPTVAPATGAPTAPADAAPTSPPEPPAARCRDPYPQGAPYSPPPDAPLRLRPTGAPPALAPAQPLPFTVDPALRRAVRQSLGDQAGRVSVVVKNLADGRGAALAADRVYYAASLFKVWVMLEAFHQREEGLLAFDERFIVSDYYQQFSLNPGELAACAEVTVEAALGRMMGVSDNVAANLLLDRVGPAHVNDALRALGLTTASIPVDGSLPATARDMALLMEAIAREQAVNPEASGEMVALLVSEASGDRLPALLPPGVQVAHKTGNWTNATHDAGIVFSSGATYVIVVLSDFGFEEDGAGVIARLSRAVYDYYNPPPR